MLTDVLANGIGPAHICFCLTPLHNMRWQDEGHMQSLVGRRKCVPRGKLVADRVTDVADIKAALVLLLVDNGTNTPTILAPGHHAKLAHIELDEVLHLSAFNFVHDCVIHL